MFFFSILVCWWSKQLTKWLLSIGPKPNISNKLFLTLFQVLFINSKFKSEKIVKLFRCDQATLKASQAVIFGKEIETQDKYSVTPLKTMLMCLGLVISRSMGIIIISNSISSSRSLVAISQYQLYMAVDPGNCCLQLKSHYFSILYQFISILDICKFYVSVFL